MELDYTRIKSLQNHNNLSDRAMGKMIGMSHTGYTGMMENKSCKVETLLAICAVFNKPLMFFFTNDNQNTVAEEQTGYQARPPDKVEKSETCENPACKKEKEEWIMKYINLLEEVNELRKEGERSIKSSKGGLEKSQATG